MKVLKHLKPYIFSLIIIFAVLFVQANCDLAMPDQMSNLVTVGLQQHGLEKPLPPQLKADDYNLLKLFMSEDNQKNIDKYYSSQKADGKEVFALKSDLNDEQKTKAAAVMTDPLLVYVALNSGGLDAQIAEAMDNFKTQQEEAAKQAALAQQGANDSVDLESLTPEQLAAMQAAQSGATQPDLAQQNAAQAFANLPTTGKELIEFLKSDDIPQEMKTAFSAQTSGGAANSQAMDALDQSTKEQTAISGAVELTKASGYDLGNPQINYIIFAGLIMLAYSLVVALCQIAVTYFASKVGAGFSRNLRLSVFDKVIGFSNKELNNFSAASLITRSTNDIQQVQLVVIMVLRMVLYAPIIGIGAFFRVLNSGPSMAWVIGVAILSILTLAVLLISIAMPKFTSLQKLVDRINLVSREILSGIPVIRAFAREKHEEERFDVENKKLLKNYLFVNRLMSTMMPLMFFIMNSVSVLIIWVGAGQVDNGSIQVGGLMAFIAYTMQIIFSFLMLTMISVMVPRAIVSGRRISEVLKVEPSVTDPKRPIEFKADAPAQVEFKDVSFKYPGAEENVLSNISFTAQPGKTTAIIGGTGSGKSTLINLIPRFFDVTSGQILVAGEDVTTVQLDKLRQKIGYVPQKGMLFSGTIKSNIAYGGSNITQEEIETAAAVAQADDFIEQKTDKYDSEIAQGGTNVSGGQRQRLSIARAIAKNPDIYIFDDSFSALDFKTDSALRAALQEHTGGSTVLIVAQRISTVLNADQIIVLNNGEIAGLGTHKELLQSCEVYKEIAESQLSENELRGQHNG